MESNTAGARSERRAPLPRHRGGGPRPRGRRHPAHRRRCEEHLRIAPATASRVPGAGAPAAGPGPPSPRTPRAAHPGCAGARERVPTAQIRKARANGGAERRAGSAGGRAWIREPESVPVRTLANPPRAVPVSLSPAASIPSPAPSRSTVSERFPAPAPGRSAGSGRHPAPAPRTRPPPVRTRPRPRRPRRRTPDGPAGRRPALVRGLPRETARCAEAAHPETPCINPRRFRCERSHGGSRPGPCIPQRRGTHRSPCRPRLSGRRLGTSPTSPQPSVVGAASSPSPAMLWRMRVSEMTFCMP